MSTLTLLVTRVSGNLTGWRGYLGLNIIKKTEKQLIQLNELSSLRKIAYTLHKPPYL